MVRERATKGWGMSRALKVYLNWVRGGKHLVLGGLRGERESAGMVRRRVSACHCPGCTRKLCGTGQDFLWLHLLIHNRV